MKRYKNACQTPVIMVTIFSIWNNFLSFGKCLVAMYCAESLTILQRPSKNLRYFYKRQPGGCKCLTNCTTVVACVLGVLSKQRHGIRTKRELWKLWHAWRWKPLPWRKCESWMSELQNLISLLEHDLDGKLQLNWLVPTEKFGLLICIVDYKIL